jgi:hypothetical protein
LVAESLQSNRSEFVLDQIQKLDDTDFLLPKTILRGADELGRDAAAPVAGSARQTAL